MTGAAHYFLKNPASDSLYELARYRLAYRNSTFLNVVSCADSCLQNTFLEHERFSLQFVKWNRVNLGNGMKFKRDWRKWG